MSAHPLPGTAFITFPSIAFVLPVVRHNAIFGYGNTQQVRPDSIVSAISASNDPPLTSSSSTSTPRVSADAVTEQPLIVNGRRLLKIPAVLPLTSNVPLDSLVIVKSVVDLMPDLPPLVQTTEFSPINLMTSGTVFGRLYPHIRSRTFIGEILQRQDNGVSLFICGYRCRT